MNLDLLLQQAVDKGASDLHLSPGLPPLLRIDGQLIASDAPVLASDQLMEQLLIVANQSGITGLATCYDIDFVYASAELGRFRVNCFRQQRGYAAVFRVIKKEIPSLDGFRLPAVFQSFIHYHQGLVLFTGPTGCGKSTSLAAIINHINHNQAKHIITIEDPVEFVYTCDKSLISQRQLTSDAQNYQQALRAALREDPNIIVVGELRDLETIRLALTAAETGHLVFSTLHTNSAPKTIDRIIDVFPSGEKDFIRTLLADCLTAVVGQKWLTHDTKSRSMIFEILIANPAIRNLIRDNKINQIYSVMQMGQAQGMCTFEQYMSKTIPVA